MTLEQYLKKRFRKSTLVAYTREINNYQSSNPFSEKATYKNIVEYIGSMRRQNHGRGKLESALLGIKQYYYYLMETGQRKDHPCRYMTLKDKPSKYIQLQDLFTESELALLLERKERYKILEKRNRAVIGLLIYQGLAVGEITQLTTEDINLEKGTIYVRGITNTDSRTVGLQTTQIMALHEYINKVRPVLVFKEKSNKEKRAHAAGDSKLILTWQGTAEKGEGIHYLISCFKYLFPERNLNPRTIRQSVIANLLKQGKDLRIVQAYIGHKSPDTTEKYKQSEVEELQKEIDKYHPLR